LAFVHDIVGGLLGEAAAPGGDVEHAGLVVQRTTPCALVPAPVSETAAFMKPIRKLYYNITVTAGSVVVAVIVGGLETLNLIGDELGLTDGGGFWGAIGAINDNFGIAS
jgi:high-affinity nickel permease